MLPFRGKREGEAAMSSEAGSAIVEPVLAELTEAARGAFGTGLAAVVLFEIGRAHV